MNIRKLLFVVWIFDPAVAIGDESSDLLRRVAETMGVQSFMEASWRIEGEGTYDLGVRMAGSAPERSEKVALRETYAFDPDGLRLGYERITQTTPNAPEHYFEAMDQEHRTLMANVVEERARWRPWSDYDRTLRRYFRVLPQVLLHEVMTDGELSPPKDSTFRGRPRVSFHATLSDGFEFRLIVDSESMTLDGIDYQAEFPGTGAATFEIDYGPYRNDATPGLLSSGYRVLMNGRAMKSITFSPPSPVRTTGLVLKPPSFVASAPPPPSPAPESAAQQSPPEVTIESHGGGLFMAMNIRSGVHTLVVEFPSYVVIVDAPTNAVDAHTVPVSRGSDDGESAPVRRLLDAVTARFPTKEPRYFVLTHHHVDHIGGVCEVARSTTATILAATLPDRSIACSAMNDRVELIADGDTIEEEDQRLLVRVIKSNPHSESMVVLYHPNTKSLFQADLMVPLPDPYFPSQAGMAAMRGFVDWMSKQAFPIEQVFSSHGMPVADQKLIARARGLAGIE